ncbi:Uncharacterised protein [Shigella sonnei]|nr:Uncharacterised protein [Shigella sonnei]
MNWVGGNHIHQRLFQQANRIMLARRQVLTATNAGTGGVRHL